MSSSPPMSPDLPRRRSRRLSMTRKPSRRLFSRGGGPSSVSGASLPPSAASSAGPHQLSSKRSFLAKPPAPGAARRVLAVLRDGQKRAARSRRPDDAPDPVMQSAPAAHPPDRIIEVDASEVSDGSSSGRARRPSSSASGGSATVDAAALMYGDDPVQAEDARDPHGFSFRLVGEDDVPEAPPAAAVDAERVRALQDEVRALRKEKRDMELAFAQQSRELNVLLTAMKTRAAGSSAEVQELTKQLKETRKRFTRRVRELEDDVSKHRTLHAEEVARHRAVEKELRAELDALRCGPQLPFVRTESTPAFPPRRKRAPPNLPTAYHLDATRPTVLPESVSSGGTPPRVDFARVKSAGNMHDTLRRKSGRFDAHHLSGRSSGLSKRAADASGHVGRRSPRALARRSLLRRSFIAHIHSTRYRTTRSAWQEFLGAEGTQVTPEQFARAVRTLAIASDARDRDLELLREEVCGAELCDTGVVTWDMFVRFYQRTKHEST